MTGSDKEDLVMVSSAEVSTEMARLAVLLAGSGSEVIELTIAVSVREPVVSERILRVISREVELPQARVPIVQIPLAGS